MAPQRKQPRSVANKPRDEVGKPEHYKRHLDTLLDEALQETFPASDPIAVTPRRRKMPLTAAGKRT
jgi:hypothetical protein